MGVWTSPTSSTRKCPVFHITLYAPLHFACERGIYVGLILVREFSATRGGVNLGSGSDIASMLSMSHSLISTPNGSMHNVSGVPGRRGARLSPVSEHRIKDPTRRSRSNSDRNGSSSRHRNSTSSVAGSHHAHHSDHPHRHGAGGGAGDTSAAGSRHHHPTHHTSSGSKPDELTFPRKKVPPIRPAISALTAMLAKTSSSTNPFEEYYAAITGRAEGESKSVAVYFPKATKPMGQVMELKVRKDATVEEVLGHALYKYWEEGWLPKIDEGLQGEEDLKWGTVCSAIGWILRIAEDDGEVDEDFPPPDRTGKISKFNFDAYAVLEASMSQSKPRSCNSTALVQLLTPKQSIRIGRSNPRSNAGRHASWARRRSKVPKVACLVSILRLRRGQVQLRHRWGCLPHSDR
jgi:hypothetical protein